MRDFDVAADRAGLLEQAAAPLRRRVARIGAGVQLAEDEIVALRLGPVDEAAIVPKPVQNEVVQALGRLVGNAIPLPLLRIEGHAVDADDRNPVFGLESLPRI